MNCQAHPGKVARYVCEGCEKNWCEACVRSFHAGELSSYICGRCGGPCSTLEGVPQQEPKPSLTPSPSQEPLPSLDTAMEPLPESEPAEDLVPLSVVSPTPRENQDALGDISTLDTGRLDLSSLRVGGDAPAPVAAESQSEASAASALTAPSFISLFRNFLLNPAVSFPNGMYHLNKSSGYQRRFVMIVGAFFVLILSLKWLSSSLVRGSLGLTAVSVISEGLIFSGLLTGTSVVLNLGQLRFPLSCGLVVLGTHWALLVFREVFFLFLPFFGTESVVLGGVLFLIAKIWVFGMAWVKGFRCDLISALVVIAGSFLGTALAMTFLLKIFYA